MATVRQVAVEIVPPVAWGAWDGSAGQGNVHDEPLHRVIEV